MSIVHDYQLSPPLAFFTSHIQCNKSSIRVCISSCFLQVTFTQQKNMDTSPCHTPTLNLGSICGVKLCEDHYFNFIPFHFAYMVLLESFVFTASIEHALRIVSFRSNSEKANWNWVCDRNWVLNFFKN